MTNKLTEEAIDRHLTAASVIPTGNQWIDDALAGGLDRRNMMLAAGRTGTGKTFFAVQLAQAVAKSQKNVLYFALEAEKYEIERRALYYATIRLQKQHYARLPEMRYREWLHKGYSSEWEALERQAKEQLDLETSTLRTIYRTELYTPQNFHEDVELLVNNADQNESPDLIIIDHLHHFFLQGDEMTQLKMVIHGLKRLHLRLEIPLVILTQLRKNDMSGGKNKTLPALEDIRGTAALTDVATDVLIISPFPSDRLDELPGGFRNPMFFHLAKSRTASEARAFAGVVRYDATVGGYGRDYVLCKTKAFEDPELLDEPPPIWAKHAIGANKTNIPLIERQRLDKKRGTRGDD